MLICSVLSNSTLVASAPCMVTHWQFQAVHGDGTSSFDDNGPTRLILEGIVLNSPEEWLDPAADERVGPWLMGGQWEVFLIRQRRKRYRHQKRFFGQSYFCMLNYVLTAPGTEWPSRKGI